MSKSLTASPLEKLSAFGSKRPIFSEKQLQQSSQQIVLSKAQRTTSYIKTGKLPNISSKFHSVEVSPLPYCPIRRWEKEQTMKMEYRERNLVCSSIHHLWQVLIFIRDLTPVAVPSLCCAPLQWLRVRASRAHEKPHLLQHEKEKRLIQLRCKKKHAECPTQEGSLVTLTKQQNEHGHWAGIKYPV